MKGCIITLLIIMVGVFIVVTFVVSPQKKVRLTGSSRDGRIMDHESPASGAHSWDRYTEEKVLDKGEPCVNHKYIVSRGDTESLPFSIRLPANPDMDIGDFYVDQNTLESEGFEVDVQDWHVYFKTDDDWELDEEKIPVKTGTAVERLLSATIVLRIATPMEHTEFKRSNQIVVKGDPLGSLTVTIGNYTPESESYTIIGPDQRPECL